MVGKVLPLDKFRVTDGELAFDDLSKYGSGVPLGYQIQWATFDNRRSVATNLPAALGKEAACGRFRHGIPGGYYRMPKDRGR